MDDMENCGLAYCKACVLINVTQRNIISSRTSCISNSMNNYNVNLNLTSMLQSQFLSNKDVLSAAVSEFGIADVNDLSKDISSSITQLIDNEFLSELQSTIANSQVIKLTNTTSSTFNNVTQSSIQHITEKFVTDKNIATSAIADSTFQNISNTVNDSNTLDSLGNVVFKSTITFVSAINSSVGMIMIAILIVLGLIVGSIISYILYQSFKNVVHDTAIVANQSRLNITKLSTFEQF